MEAFFPYIYEQIDVESVSSLSGEVFTDVIKGSSRRLDIVVETKLKDTGAIIIIHIEPQSSVQQDFHRRMFQYYSFLYNEYQKPIIPIVVFSYEENWEKNDFSINVLDTTYLYFRYHTLHLKKMNWREYLRKDNPVVAALLSKMGFKDEERVQVKVEFMRMLWRLQLNEADQRLIYGFFEAYLTLTEEEEERFVKLVREFDEAEEIFNLPISYEEKGREKGRREGLKEGLEKGRKEVALEMLKEEVSIEIIKRTTKLTMEEIEKLRKQL
ncbi:transposase [Pseudogracilibacillus sp. SO30301A]|uniref:transposase n=1 Tax=Pseudogracilibacillus sp. SO30301A TaxID=3098291 RepID=UPI00300E48C1